MKNLRYLVLFSVLLFACEEQMVMIPPFEIPDTDRVILVEELTGVNCPNCPKGSAKLEALISQFEGKVIGVGIHGDFLTTPLSNSKFDFRNQYSRDLENSFQPFIGKPAAVINRIHFDDQSFLAIADTDQWINYIQSELEKDPLINLNVNSEYIASTRTANITVTTIARQDINDDLKIHVMLTESDIIDVQKDVGEIIEDYQHNHVLRTMLTEWNGNGIQSNINQGSNVSSTFSYTLPEEEGLWNPDHIEVIAFITNSEGVMQAAQVHLAE